MSELANYSEYRRRLDAREVLARYGARNQTEQINKDGTTEIVHSCLLDQVEPHHAHGDAHPSAWCNIDKGLYTCSVYWSGDLIRLIQKMEGKETLAEVLPIVGEMLSGATRGVVEFQDELAKIFASHEIVTPEIPSYAPQVLNPWLVAHPYLYDERGISMETITALRLGFDPRENRIVIPHFWRGELVGWQKRAIPERDSWPGTENPHPKYRSSSGFPKSETLYGDDLARGCPAVLVVESPASVIKAHSLGLRNPAPVATFGAKTSAIQADILSDYLVVYVWFDDDLAGYHGARTLIERLMNRTRVLVVDPHEGPGPVSPDLGDFDDLAAVRARLESAVPAALWLAQRDLIEVG